MKDSRRKRIENDFMPGDAPPLERKRAHGEPPLEDSILPRTAHPAAKAFYKAEKPRVRRSLRKGDLT
jgi:hypothetical protein